MEFCCADFEQMVKVYDGHSFSVGSGEISGSVSFNQVITDHDKFVISVSDGWESYPEIIFNYCPYCGKKQGKWDGTLLRIKMP